MRDTELCWLQLGSLQVASVKEEPTESSHPLSPPPDIHPLPPYTAELPSPVCRGRQTSTLSLAAAKRVRPYPSIKHGSSPRAEQFAIMSNVPVYENWSFSGGRNGGGRLHPNAQRRGSAPDIISYAHGQPFVPEFVNQIPDPSEVRSNASSNSSLTSSLTGAMGGTNFSSQSRHSRSPPSRDDAPYSTSDWNTGQQDHSQQLSVALQYPGYSLMAYMPSDPTTDNLSLPDYSSANRTSYHSESDSSVSAEERHDSETVHLRRRVRELEAENARARAALYNMRASTTAGSYCVLPTPVSTPLQSASFQTSWKARTEARKRMFCSLNRAGNALCAWHDSRRERRAFPPRNAPPGYLNCGCTHEEALFEESLSRHGIGSYHPGETVRMDPALRNPLLKLLQQRYGYQDGDFERSSITGDWVEGEGSACWKAQAHSGASARRRQDHSHTERH